MRVVLRPNDKPNIVVICGDGRTDRGLVKRIAIKLNGQKPMPTKIWIYDSQLISGISPSALGLRAFRLAEYLAKHRYFVHTDCFVIIIDREHLENIPRHIESNILKKALPNIRQKNKSTAEINLDKKKIMIGVCGEERRIEENLAELAEAVLNLPPNTLPRNKKLKSILRTKYGIDYYDLIEKANMDLIIKHLKCIGKILISIHNTLHRS